MRTKAVWLLIRKDILLEMRQRHAFYGVLLYVLSTIFVLYLTIEQPQADTWIALFWVTQLFICINAVAKSFLQESPGRMLYFHMVVSPTEFMTAKLTYNLLLMTVMNTASLLLFLAFMGDPTTDAFRFFGISWLGSAGLSLVFTMLAAIATKALQQASLMAILGFPLILPQLLLLMKLSRTVLGESFSASSPLQVAMLLMALDVSVAVLSLILFPFLWKE